MRVPATGSRLKSPNHLFSARKAQEEDAKQETKIRNNDKELKELRETTKKLAVEMEKLQKKASVWRFCKTEVDPCIIFDSYTRLIAS